MEEYELVQINPSDFQDPHGNTWCDVAFKGISEPVKWVVKDPRSIKEGESYYGEIKDMTSKAGKPYLRFYRSQRPDDHSTPHSNKKEWTPRDDEAIKAQWALGRAYERNGKSEKTVEEAQWLFQQIEVIKGGEVQEASQSGYEKFKASKPTPKEEADAEFASAIAKGLEADGVNIDDIPF